MEEGLYKVGGIIERGMEDSSERVNIISYETVYTSTNLEIAHNLCLAFAIYFLTDLHFVFERLNCTCRFLAHYVASLRQHINQMQFEPTPSHEQVVFSYISTQISSHF